MRASWTLRTARPEVPTPGTNRQVTVFGAIEVSTGRWVYRLGRRCAADFIALLDQVLRAFPRAPVIVMICDNDSIHHADLRTPGQARRAVEESVAQLGGLDLPVNCAGAARVFIGSPATVPDDEWQDALDIN